MTLIQTADRIHAALLIKVIGFMWWYSFNCKVVLISSLILKLVLVLTDDLAPKSDCSPLMLSHNLYM